MSVINLSFLRGWSCALFTFATLWLLIGTAPARADIEAGVSWLASREGATGVHAETDLAVASDTNAEAWLTLFALGRSDEFLQLSGLVSDHSADDLFAVARQGLIRINQGLSAGTQLDTLLSAQHDDGGFPVRTTYESEPLTTAWVLQLLQRSGLASGTPASRALGYLMNAQQEDGGWRATSGSSSSVFVTAMVGRALMGYRSLYNLSLQISRARNYLVSQEGPQHEFGDLVASAAAVEALLAMQHDSELLQGAVTALASQQLADGSFADDAYVTAWVLRALWRHEQPEVPVSSAGITGRILAADTDLPITGATFSLDGPSTSNLISNNEGRIHAGTLEPGEYSATLSYAGMRDMFFDLNLVDGRILDLGDLRMIRSTDPGASFGLIRGRVTSTETDEPIANALVTLSNPASQVRTDADGRYQFLQVLPGTVQVSASPEGYCAHVADVEVEPFTIIELSIRLVPLSEPIVGAEIRGQVRNGQTDQPLAGVTVAVTDGAPGVSTITAGDGTYSLVSETGSLVTITSTLDGFDPVTIQTPLYNNQVLEFSPRMYPEGETPGGANRPQISGVVVNQANRQPIRNALVVAMDAGGQRVTRSEEDGRFVLTELTGPTVRVALSADAFEPTTLVVPLLPLEQRDVGQVGLKPTTVDFYLPDLIVVASTLSTTDPDSFLLDSTFQVDVANRGNSSLTQDFTLLAFVDGNGDGVFDQGSEPEVGRVRVHDDLPVGSTTTVSIAASAQLGFRDAPIAFWVDAENEISEENEDNNTGSSLLGCRMTPAFVGNDSIYEAWRWSGLSSNPLVNSLNQTPAVVQLNDDNGDGVINQYDIPDVVFVAGRRSSGSPSQTALVALSGRDGSELWARTDIRLSHYSSPAVGDLDNDGIADIVVVTGYREELIAFNNDGSIKWRTNVNGPGIPIPLIPPPSYVYDELIIVNLDGDNEAEVIHGRKAFRGRTGELLWEGEFDAGGDDGGVPPNAPLLKAYSVAAVAADINLDGVLEVIAGRSAYDFEGRTLWHRGDINEGNLYFDHGVPRTPVNVSGFNAIGNFDADDYPEIVLASRKELWLLEHTGETVWGPVTAPDDTDLGVPTVIDLDQDGLPEILVPSKTRMTVFETDGTVKWSQEIEDSSGVTGVTVFDFEDDGNFEVIHYDEENLRIFDARTGDQRFFTRNTSVTVFEYPVIADIDGDGQAEVLVTGFDIDLVAGVTPGLRVFKARDGAWARAGRVWGSHAFHRDDIREDGTIPLQETPSWLTHNTYRVQRSPEPDPLGMPDFTVGDLRLIDRGPSLNPLVQVRVGNAGPVDAHEPPWIGIYRGDPDVGGVLLTESRLDTLRPARFQIVNLGEISLAGAGELYAVVDQRGRANECRTGNNRRVIPFSATSGQGQLQLTTDKLSYTPGDLVTITAQVDNQGGLPAGYTVDWSIRNHQNLVTAELDPEFIAELAAGATESRDRIWSSGGVLAGTYSVVGSLRDASDTVIDTSTVAFLITGDATGPAGALNLVFDRPAYAQGEPVVLDVRAQNLSSSEVMRLPEVSIEVTGPDGYSHQASMQLDDLFAGSFMDREFAVPGATAPGIYQVTGMLRSRLTGHLYDTRTADFERLPDSTGQIQGFINVARPSLMAGESQTCLVTARNQGSVIMTGVPLRLRVLSLDDGTGHLEREMTVDLAPGIDHISAEDFSTTGYMSGDYACLLERYTGSDWLLLASEPFSVTGLPSASILVEPTAGLVTSEGGQTAQFMVRLTRPPLETVTIAMTVSDESEWALSNDTVVFSPATWDVPRQVVVAGVDDDTVDGDQSGHVHLMPAVSGDPAYNGIDPDDVAVTNLDDDGAQILVAPTAVETTEGGSSAQFQVWLNAEPQAEVVIDLESSDLSEWTVSPQALVFNAGNWNQPLAVSVTGIDDDEIDGDQTGWIILHPAQSGDPRFDGMDPTDVQALNRDNDLPTIHVDPLTVVTSEAGLTGAFTIRLSAAPSAEVTIPIGPVDASEWQILDTDVVLDANNWQSGRTVQVLPVDDDEADGEQSQTLLLGPAASSDTRFDNLDPEDVTLVNQDDDSAAILVEPVTGLVVHEWGSTAQFMVSLTEAPVADVRIELLVGDPTELSVAPDELVFATGDWAPRLVTVTGVDDAEFDGNQVGLIQVLSAVSGDTRYDGIDPRDVSATNIDDEIVQVVVEPQGSIETSEDGTAAQVSITINAPPTDDVRIDLVNPDASEWAFDRDVLIFTPSNWAGPRILTVTGVDDSEVDGDITGVIGLLPVISADPRYQGIDPIDIPALNRDNDQAPASIIVTPPGVIETSEDGDSAVIEVRLGTAPTSPVRVDLGLPDANEWHVDAEFVEFDPTTWAAPRQIVITGVDDDVVDGDITGLLQLLPAVSSDPRYHGIDPADVPLVNRDNDTPPPVEILVLPAGLVETSEDGSSATVEVRLSTIPAGPVRVDLAHPDTGEWHVDVDFVEFEPMTWATPRQIVVTGVDDDVVDGDASGVLQLLPAVSADPRYHGIDPADVPLVNRDNDVPVAAGLRINPVDLVVSESGDAGRFEVSLSRRPIGPVHLQIASGDSGEVLVLPMQLQFVPDNAHQPQLVTLSGVDDFLVDGDQVVPVQLSVMGSPDPDFAALPPVVLSVTNLDDDQAGIVLRLRGAGEIQEGQGTDLSLALTSEPVVPVTVQLEAVLRPPGQPGNLDFRLTPVVVTWTPGNWFDERALRLQTRDNGRIDGDQIIDVRVVSVESGDPVYAGQSAVPAMVRVLDRGLPVANTPVPVPGNRGLTLLIILILLATASRLHHITRRGFRAP